MIDSTRKKVREQYEVLEEESLQFEGGSSGAAFPVTSGTEPDVLQGDLAFDADKEKLWTYHPAKGILACRSAFIMVLSLIRHFPNYLPTLTEEPRCCIQEIRTNTSNINLYWL